MKILALSLTLVLCAMLLNCKAQESTETAKENVLLPEPDIKGTKTVESAIAERRSIRSFTDKALTMKEIGQILWSAQGITDKTRGFRASPSAGALFPLEVFAVTPEALYRYIPKTHTLEVVERKDYRADLAKAAYNQQTVRNAPLVVVITADVSKTKGRYGEMAERFVFMEAGHVAQNIHLQAVSLGLGSVPVGGFSPPEVDKVLGLDKTLETIYMIPVGHPRQ